MLLLRTLLTLQAVPLLVVVAFATYFDVAFALLAAGDSRDPGQFYSALETGLGLMCASLAAVMLVFRLTYVHRLWSLVALVLLEVGIFGVATLMVTVGGAGWFASTDPATWLLGLAVYSEAVMAGAATFVMLLAARVHEHFAS